MPRLSIIMIPLPERYPAKTFYFAGNTVASQTYQYFKHFLVIAYPFCLTLSQWHVPWALCRTPFGSRYLHKEGSLMTETILEIKNSKTHGKMKSQRYPHTVMSTHSLFFRFREIDLLLSLYTYSSHLQVVKSLSWRQCLLKQHHDLTT